MRPKPAYIWRHGILEFGLPVALFTTSYTYVRQHGWTLGPLFSMAGLIGFVAGVAIGALIGGCLFGSLFWWFTARSRREIQP